jgi:hypothetical protein
MNTEYTQARELHQKYYSGNFEITRFKRSGFVDVPPFSFVYGISDIGGWTGIISTDGNNFVISRTALFDENKILQSWEIKNPTIANVKVGTFKTHLELKDKIAGLTTKTTHEFLWILLFSLPFAFIPLLFVSRKRISIRLKNPFESRRLVEGSLRELIKK